MTEVTFPLPNPAADRLLERYLDRASPGWRRRIFEPLSSGTVMQLLWPLAANLRQILCSPATNSGEIRVDRALEAIADGAALDFDSLDVDAKAALAARLLVAMTCAGAGEMTPGPVMRLPHGLTEAQLFEAVTLRALYQAPLSLEGLR